MIEMEIRNLTDTTVPLKDEGGWLAEGRLPIGCTVVTGLGGMPCSLKDIETPLMSVVIEYVTTGAICGCEAESGEVLWVNLGSSARIESALSSGCGEDAESVYVSTPRSRAKVGSELASAIDSALDELPDVRLVVVSSTGVGVEGRGKMGRHVADLGRVAKSRDCAVVLVVPLRRANAMCVEDPSTGIASAADAVWKIYTAGCTIKCFCTHGTGGEAFDVAPVPQGRRSAKKEGIELLAGLEEPDREEGNLSEVVEDLEDASKVVHEAE